MNQPSLPLDGEREVWTVSEILDEVRHGLEASFPEIRVRGEVTGLRAVRSGHWYFGLKDEQSVLPVAMFRSDNRSVRFDLEEGLEVTAGGRLTLYAAQGRFQLIATKLEPAGWGAQQLAYEQLKRRLLAEGLFAEERKRPLPRLPSCVGVVTSAHGAAWHDMRKVWQRRGVALRALLSPARVQGEHAAAEIVAALELIAEHGSAEVIIVGRGGGSREDLWAFNEEPVARAIAACPVPVVSAVGHEVDFAISDLVADVRAATPTAAAEIVAPSRDQLAQRAATLLQRVRRGCDATVARAGRGLNAVGMRRALREPVRTLATYEQRVDDAWDRAERGVRTRLELGRRRQRGLATTLIRQEPRRVLGREQQRLRALGARLRAHIEQDLQARRVRLGAAAARTEALSPLAVLGRGYALCQDGSGALLRDAASTEVGATVGVRLARGRLSCEVTSTDTNAEER